MLGKLALYMLLIATKTAISVSSLRSTSMAVSATQQASPQITTMQAWIGDACWAASVVAANEYETILAAICANPLHYQKQDNIQIFYTQRAFEYEYNFRVNVHGWVPSYNSEYCALVGPSSSPTQAVCIMSATATMLGKTVDKRTRTGAEFQKGPMTITAGIEKLPAATAISCPDYRPSPQLKESERPPSLFSILAALGIFVVFLLRNRYHERKAAKRRHERMQESKAILNHALSTST